MGEKAKKSVVRKLVGRETGSLFQKEIGINYLPNMVVNVKANMPRLGEQAEVTGGDMGLFAQKEVEGGGVGDGGGEVEEVISGGGGGLLKRWRRWMRLNR